MEVAQIGCTDVGQRPTVAPKMPLGFHGRRAPQHCIDFCFSSSDHMRTRSPLRYQLSSTWRFTYRDLGGRPRARSHGGPVPTHVEGDAAASLPLR